jgi:hypothetical protein
MMFLGSSCRETAKNDQKKIEGKRREKKYQLFWPEAFDMDFLPKVLVVFLNSPCLVQWPWPWPNAQTQ